MNRPEKGAQSAVKWGSEQNHLDPHEDDDGDDVLYCSTGRSVCYYVEFLKRDKAQDKHQVCVKMLATC